MLGIMVCEVWYVFSVCTLIAEKAEEGYEEKREEEGGEGGEGKRGEGKREARQASLVVGRLLGKSRVWQGCFHATHGPVCRVEAFL